MSDVPPLMVFIDANVYLSFFGYTKEDLSHLLKIKSLIESEAIQLYVPQQTRFELDRREKTLSTSV